MKKVLIAIFVCLIFGCSERPRQNINYEGFYISNTDYLNMLFIQDKFYYLIRSYDDVNIEISKGRWTVKEPRIHLDDFPLKGSSPFYNNDERKTYFSTDIITNHKIKIMINYDLNLYFSKDR
jgi:hypothetical protein